MKPNTERLFLTPPNIGRIECKIRPDGEFFLVLCFKPEAQKINGVWNTHIFRNPKAQGFFPGHIDTVDAKIQENAFTVYGLADYSSPAMQQRLIDIQDPQERQYHADMREAQKEWQRKIGAPNIPCALTARLLAKLIDEKEVPHSYAMTFLQANFKTDENLLIGDRLAAAILQRATEQLRLEKRGVN